MSGAPRGAARLLAVVGVLAAGVLVSRGVARMRAAPEPPPVPSVAEFDFDAGTARFAGRLSPPAVREMERLGLGARDTALVVVLTEEDVLKCEDLGRQLREVRRAYGPDRPIMVWGDSAGTEMLAAFLRRERIPRAVVGAVAPGAVLSDGEVVWTPAAILVTRDGRIVEGVSHTLRAPNVRLRSFAQELVSLRGPRGSRGDPDG